MLPRLAQRPADTVADGAAADWHLDGSRGDAEDGRQHRRHLQHREGQEAQRRIAERHGQSSDGGTDQLTGDRHGAHQPGSGAHLALGHEVRHVALEGPLGEVARELEQGQQDGQGKECLGVGERDQEEHIESRAHQDPRPPATQPRVRVVAQGRRHRLHHEGHDGADQADHTDGDLGFHGLSEQRRGELLGGQQGTRGAVASRVGR